MRLEEHLRHELRFEQYERDLFTAPSIYEPLAVYSEADRIRLGVAGQAHLPEHLG